MKILKLSTIFSASIHSSLGHRDRSIHIDSWKNHDIWKPRVDVKLGCFRTSKNIFIHLKAYLSQLLLNLLFLKPSVLFT